jgi:hypothetical protein
MSQNPSRHHRPSFRFREEPPHDRIQRGTKSFWSKLGHAGTRSSQQLDQVGKPNVTITKHLNIQDTSRTNTIAPYVCLPKSLQFGPMSPSATCRIPNSGSRGGENQAQPAHSTPMSVQRLRGPGGSSQRTASTPTCIQSRGRKCAREGTRLTLRTEYMCH